jgi:predicted DNA-binding protein (MmcQ/YjbR family)
MNIEELREYCLSFKTASEGFPFDETTLVFKVAGKMFLLTDLEEPDRVNVKCDPELAEDLRERYPQSVFPGYHMSKKHWNTVIMHREVDDDLLKQWIADSYNLVAATLPKKVRFGLEKE